jgi:hypothetical protein
MCYKASPNRNAIRKKFGTFLEAFRASTMLHQADGIYYRELNDVGAWHASQ